MKASGNKCEKYTLPSFRERLGLAGQQNLKRRALLRVHEVYTSRKSCYVASRGVLQDLSSLKRQGMRVVVPSFEVLSHFTSLLSSLPVPPSLDALLLLQTCLRYTLEETKAQQQSAYSRLCKSLLVDAPSALRMVFLNELSSLIHTEQRVEQHKYKYKETSREYAVRLFGNTIQHLRVSEGINVVVLVVDTLDFVSKVCREVNAPTITVEEYLEQNEHLKQQARELLTSLRDSSSSSVPKTTDGKRVKEAFYPSHLSALQMRTALSTGDVYKGKLFVYKHSPHEGEVELEQPVHGVSNILIRSRKAMNRAFDGDEVVVQINPKDEWCNPMSQLVLFDDAAQDEETEGEKSKGRKQQQGFGGNDKVDEDEEGDEALGEVALSPRVAAAAASAAASSSAFNLPTGTIVGIRRRSINEVIVSVPHLRDSSTSPSSSSGVSSTISPALRLDYILVVPSDKKFPKFRLKTRQWAALQGQKISVLFDDWPADSLYPNAHFVRSLGDASDWRVAIEGLLLRYSIFPRPFSVNALACLPVVPVPSSPCSYFANWSVAPSELALRRDLRQNRDIFSVDPPGCQDIDDAMHWHWLDEQSGLAEVGVSIADVDAFVKQGSALDLEAQARGTTIYLTHTRMDMLPALLSGDLCSLHGGKDRYAVTVQWRVFVKHKDGRPVRKEEDPLALDEQDDIIFEAAPPESPDGSKQGDEADTSVEKGKVMKISWAGRSIIRSCASMTYQQAHNLVEHCTPDDNNEKDPHRKKLEPVAVIPEGQAGGNIDASLWPKLRQDLSYLTALARCLRRKRSEDGALDLTQQEGGEGGEIRFELNNEGVPVRVKRKEQMEVHKTIEELMVVTNSTVAQFIYQHTPLQGLVRIHPPPTAAKMKRVQELALTANLPIFGAQEGRGATKAERGGMAGSDLQAQLRNYRSKMLHFAATKPGGGKGEKAGRGTASASASSAATFAGVDLVTSLVIKAMNEALYKCSGSLVVSSCDDSNADKGESEVGHWAGNGGDTMKHAGLGLVYYTHFTSPIRRYADVIVHRQLLALVDTKLRKRGGGAAAVQHEQQQQQQQQQSLQLQEEQKGEEQEEQEEEDDFLDSLLADVGTDLSSPIVSSGLTTTASSSSSSDAFPPLSLAALASSSASSSSDFDFAAAAAAAAVDDNDDAHTGKSSTLTKVAEEEDGSSTTLPYTSAHVASMCDHLNAKNREAKQAQFECSRLFLCLYFQTHTEIHTAVIYGLRANGFLVYVSAFDVKCVCFLANREGLVTLDERLVVEEGGEKCAVGDKGSGLVGYPQLECVLVEDSSETHTHTQIHDTPAAATKRLCLTQRNSHPVMSFAPMQAVCVEISCSYGDTLRCRLVSATHTHTQAHTKASKNASAIRQVVATQAEVAAAAASVPPPLGFSSFSSLGSSQRAKEAGRSLFSVCRSFRSSMCGSKRNAKAISNDLEVEEVEEEEKEEGKGIEGEKSKQGGKVPFTSSCRHEAGGGGRMFWTGALGVASKDKAKGKKVCVEESLSSIPLLYRSEEEKRRAAASASSSDSSSGLGGNTSFLGDGAATGIMLAKTKMKEWGEEWAEEEDLVSSYEQEEGIGEGSGGGTSGIPKPLSKALNKEVALAQVRMNQLKTEKRKGAKY